MQDIYVIGKRPSVRENVSNAVRGQGVAIDPELPVAFRLPRGGPDVTSAKSGEVRRYGTISVDLFMKSSSGIDVDLDR